MKNLFAHIRIVLVALALTIAGILQAQNLDDAKNTFNTAIKAFQAEDFETSVEAFENVVKVCTGLVENYEDEEAEDLMYQAIEKIPGIYVKISVNALQNKEVKKGIEFAEKAKQAAIDYEDNETLDKAKGILANVYTKMGGLKFKNGDFDGALADLDKAIAEDENYASAYLYKSAVYKDKEDHEAFKKNIDLTIEKASSPRERKTKGQATGMGQSYFLKLGNDEYNASNFENAEKYLKYSMEYNSSDPRAIRLLFEVYKGMKDFDKTVEYGAKSLDVTTESDLVSKINYDLGKLYQEKDNKASACEHFRKAQIGAYAANAKYEIEQVLKCE